MTIRINGENKELPTGSTITMLLESLDSNRPGVAVAVDGTVVPRSQHPTVELRDGQNVEVVGAVGGG